MAENNVLQAHAQANAQGLTQQSTVVTQVHTRINNNNNNNSSSSNNHGPITRSMRRRRDTTSTTRTPAPLPEDGMFHDSNPETAPPPPPISHRLHHRRRRPKRSGRFILRQPVLLLPVTGIVGMMWGIASFLDSSHSFVSVLSLWNNWFSSSSSASSTTPARSLSSSTMVGSHHHNNNNNNKNVPENQFFQQPTRRMIDPSHSSVRGRTHASSSTSSSSNKNPILLHHSSATTMPRHPANEGNPVTTTTTTRNQSKAETTTRTTTSTIPTKKDSNIQQEDPNDVHNHNNDDDNDDDDVEWLWAIPNRLIFTHKYNLLQPLPALSVANHHDTTTAATRNQTITTTFTTTATTTTDPYVELQALQANVHRIIALHQPPAEPSNSTTKHSAAPPSVLFWTNDECVESLHRVLPALVPYFQHEPTGMFLADMCRGTALYEYGGLYCDVDLGVRMNLFRALQHPTTATLVTAQVHFASRFAHRGFFQAFVGATPRHPVLYQYLLEFLHYYQQREKQEQSQRRPPRNNKTMTTTNENTLKNANLRRKDDTSVEHAPSATMVRPSPVLNQSESMSSSSSSSSSLESTSAPSLLLDHDRDPLGVVFLKRALDRVVQRQEQEKQRLRQGQGQRPPTKEPHDETNVLDTIELWQEVDSDDLNDQALAMITAHDPSFQLPYWNVEKRACRMMVLNPIPSSLPLPHHSNNHNSSSSKNHTEVRLVVPFYSRIANSRLCPHPRTANSTVN